MNQNEKRDEQKAKPETREPQKPKRFLIVRLEERIAPRSGNGNGHGVRCDDPTDCCPSLGT